MTPNLDKYSMTDYIQVFCADCQYHTVKKSKIVGFCRCDIHRGWLTDNIAKTHNCEAKNCVFLQKINEHEFWERTTKKAEKRKQQKELIKEIKEKKAKTNFNRENHLKRMKNFAQNIVDYFNYPIILTRIKLINEEKREIILNYISDKNYNDYKTYNEIAIQLGKQYGYHFLLKKVRRPDGRYATREDWYNHNKEVKA